MTITTAAVDSPNQLEFLEAVSIGASPAFFL